MRVLAGLILALLMSCTGVLGDGHEEAATTTPVWSTYWYPFRDGTLATGKACFGEPGGDSYWEDWTGGFAPFEKLSGALGADPRGNLYNWEYRNHYDPLALDWYGHCNGFAAASSIEPEPAGYGEMQRIYFRLGDKKAILCEAHQNDGAVMFGTRYTGGAGEDKSDIRPDLFHKTLRHYILELDKPILVETDPDVQIWNYPCYRYVTDWVDNGATRHVTTTIYLALDGVSPDTAGVVYQDYTYTYDLTMSGGEIVSGTWTGGSVDNHPDFLWEAVSVQSGNPYLDTAQARLIAGLSPAASLEDDLYEPNNAQGEAVEAPYDVLFGRLLNEDWFKVPVETGESLSVEIHPEKLGVSVTASLHRESGEVIGSAAQGEAPFTLTSGFLGTTGWVWLRLVPASAQTNRRNYQVIVQRTGNVATMPHVANACEWTSRLFLFNPGPAASDLYFHFYETSGSGALHKTYPATLGSLSAHQFVSGPIASFFSTFDTDCARWMNIRSAGPLEGHVLFTADGERNLAGVRLQDTPATTLHFNHLAVDTLWWTGIAVVNVDTRHAATLTLRPYTADGASYPADVVTVNLPPGERLISMLSQLFSAEALGRASWIKVEADRPVTGFELFGTQDLGMCEGIPLQNAGEKELYAPWVPDPAGGWWTGMTLVNAGTSQSVVKIWPFTADGIYAIPPPYYKQVTVLGRRKYAVMLDQLFPQLMGGPVAYVAIEATNPVTGFVLYGNFTQNLLSGYPFAGAGEFRQAGAFGAVDGAWLVFNNARGDDPAVVTLEAFDAAGTKVATAPPLTVPAVSLVRTTPQAAFAGALPAEWSWIVWKSDRAVLAGEDLVQSNRGTYVFSTGYTD
ncbi:MAG: hypothetical protein KA419_16085 [Acidobacteria bacterium]|nr:hypothetical protein [Acidobacteriota bacterium]